MPRSAARPTRTRPHPAAVLTVIAVAWVIGVLLATSDRHGTGALDVGDDGSTALAAGPAASPAGCTPSRSNPGGLNNYVPKAPFLPALGRGFVVTGTVRGADCRPLPGVRVQVWAQSATAGETRNRASVRTAADGTYRMETDPLVSQFGEPNVHVAYTDPDYVTVALRNVTTEGDARAVVDLVLEPDR